MLAVALANYPSFGGRPCAFDGMAFSLRDSSPRDHCIAQAGGGEEIVLARIDLDALSAYRRAESLADAYRKHGCHPLPDHPIESR